MNESLVSVLQHEGIAVLATDTIYGIVGSATSEAVVRRLYELKGRDEGKPFIILIPAIETLEQFGVEITDASREVLSRVWPGPVTVILPVKEESREQLQYLHRGTNSLAFRMPAKETVSELIGIVGPLIAPSANPQGMPPATTITEARDYFGTRIDHYEDEGLIVGEPSTIITVENGTIEVIRQGSVYLDKR